MIAITSSVASPEKPCGINQTRMEPTTTIYPNVWVFVYELNGCGFESRCSHINFRYPAFFEQGLPWHSGNYRLQIHCKKAYVTWQEHTGKWTSWDCWHHQIIKSYQFVKTWNFSLIFIVSNMKISIFITMFLINVVRFLKSFCLWNSLEASHK